MTNLPRLVTSTPCSSRKIPASRLGTLPQRPVLGLMILRQPLRQFQGAGKEPGASLSKTTLPNDLSTSSAVLPFSTAAQEEPPVGQQADYTSSHADRPPHPPPPHTHTTIPHTRDTHMLSGR